MLLLLLLLLLLPLGIGLCTLRCLSLGGLPRRRPPTGALRFGREGVRIRDTFIRVGGVRIHTIETLDEKRTRAPLGPLEKPLGLSGLSFRVPDLDEAHARATAEGRNPTEIYAFSELEEPVRMFFLEDPDGLRVEMIEDGH